MRNGDKRMTTLIFITWLVSGMAIALFLGKSSDLS
jgi:hypothetical protein